MSHKFAEIAFTSSVVKAQEDNGSRKVYAPALSGPDTHNRLTATEAAFIATRNSFFMATVGETGWPYLQHRGGPAGFLRVLDETTIGFADFRGNRQYITVGNLALNEKVSLFLMDYANRARLKILGRARIAGAEDPELVQKLAVPGYRAVVERAMIVSIEAYDWNCSQHIPQLYSADELAMLDAAPLPEGT